MAPRKLDLANVEVEALRVTRGGGETYSGLIDTGLIDTLENRWRRYQPRLARLPVSDWERRRTGPQFVTLDTFPPLR